MLHKWLIQRNWYCCDLISCPFIRQVRNGAGPNWAKCAGEREREGEFCISEHNIHHEWTRRPHAARDWSRCTRSCSRHPHPSSPWSPARTHISSAPLILCLLSCDHAVVLYVCNTSWTGLPLALELMKSVTPISFPAQANFGQKVAWITFWVVEGIRSS
jgi:hypothetical protein